MRWNVILLFVLWFLFGSLDMEMGVYTDIESPEGWTAGHRMDFAHLSLIKLLARCLPVMQKG